MNNLVVENARIIFRNFSGAPSQYNTTGKRTFSIVLDEDVAKKLKDDGWNVKPLKARDPEDPQEYQLPVEVKYAKYPPKIFMVNGRSKTLLTEETVGNLDYLDIENIDIVVNPSEWEFGGKSGVKAYVKEMYVVVATDYFANKYNFEQQELAEAEHPTDDEDLPF